MSVKRNIKIQTVLSIVTALLLTGCSQGSISSVDERSGQQEGSSPEEVAFVSMEDEPVLSYDVPRSLPHIVVDELGYLTDSNKVVFFFGEEIPEEFYVKDAGSGIIVYTGKTQMRSSNDIYDFNVGYGEFTDFTNDGRYFVEAPLLGRSYEFEISPELYSEIFRESCKTYYYNRCGITLTSEYAKDNAHNACHLENAVLRDDITILLDVTGGWHQDGTGSKNIERASKVMSNILLSYEVFPAAFTDDVGIPESGNGIPDILDETRYEAEWMLKMQDKSTGAVYSELTVSQGADGKDSVYYIERESVDSSFAFAFVMAKFSYLYQDYDKEFATTCLKAADRAYRYGALSESSSNTTDISAYRFPAASEIYRASASRECEDYLKAYFSSQRYKDSMDYLCFCGCITYLNNRQKVDKEYCESVIKQIMQYAEAISVESRNAPFLVPGNKEQSNNSELLEKMMVMTIVDHIISNHEYDTIIENYLHYFLGRNAMSIVYLDNVGTRSYKDIFEGLGLMKQFESDSMLIFMMSRIISKDGFAG